MKIKLSKTEWERAGQKSGWLKTLKKAQGEPTPTLPREPVENQTNQTTSKQITVNVKGIDFVFRQGEIYRDAAGEYTVLDIDGDKLKVLYSGGLFANQEKIWTAKSRAEIIYNERIREQRRTNPAFNIHTGFFEDAQFFVMGLIAKYGYIALQVPENEVSSFIKSFTNLTGKPPTKNQYNISKDEDKWHQQWSVRVGMDIDSAETQTALDIFTKMGLKPKPINAGGFGIYDSSYTRQLISLGFKDGKSDSLYKNIAKNIMQRYGRHEAEFFLKGFGITNPEEVIEETKETAAP